MCVGKATVSLIYLRDKAVAFNARSIPRDATDKMALAQFPTPTATTRLKEPRKGAPRTLGRQSTAWSKTAEVSLNLWA